ncbi:hypothetical protein GCM10022252_08460 [Streptosporangium oxazolinicum]|uniref:Uncharacterized protein n=1 Tax=Streptosporangium oxazolinicum TaxID=909287 RepID=A0ABP8AE57_9ACTN
MISRRSPTGTGHPGRHEYSSRSRATRETFAENFGGPVGVGDAVVGGLVGGVTTVGSGAATSVTGEDAEIGAEVTGGAAGAGPGVAVPHEAAARQPAAVASAARVRVMILKPDTSRPLRKNGQKRQKASVDD